MMSFLISKKMREIKLSQILFKILKILLPFLKIIKLIQQTLKDIFSGNLSRVSSGINKWFIRKKARISYEIQLGLKKLSASKKHYSSN